MGVFFAPKKDVNVFSILHIFLATRTVFKIGEYQLRYFPGFSLGIFGPVTRLDQSRERKYLKDYKNKNKNKNEKNKKQSMH